MKPPRPSLVDMVQQAEAEKGRKLRRAEMSDVCAAHSKAYDAWFDSLSSEDRKAHEDAVFADLA